MTSSYLDKNRDIGELRALLRDFERKKKRLKKDKGKKADKELGRVEKSIKAAKKAIGKRKKKD